MSAGGSEKVVAEGFRHAWFEKFAREDINEGAVLNFVEVHSDGRCFDKLHRRVALKLSLGKTLDEWRAELFHRDGGAQTIY